MSGVQSELRQDWLTPEYQRDQMNGCMGCGGQIICAVCDSCDDHCANPENHLHPPKVEQPTVEVVYPIEHELKPEDTIPLPKDDVKAWASAVFGRHPGW